MSESLVSHPETQVQKTQAEVKYTKNMSASTAANTHFKSALDQVVKQKKPTVPASKVKDFSPIK